MYKKADMHADTCTQTNQKGDTYLYVRFAREADDHEEQDGNNVVVEAGPVVDFEGRYKGTHQHEENRAGTQNRTTCFNQNTKISIYFSVAKYILSIFIHFNI